MNILILCGHNLSQYDYASVINMTEHNVYLFADELFVTKEAVEMNNKMYREIRVYNDYFSNPIVELDAIELHNRINIDAVVAIREMDILRAARLRDYFKISEGQSYLSACAFRDKILMKEYARQANLKTPNYKLIRTATDLYEFIETYKYPVFVKPIASAGSVNAKALRNRADLSNFIENNLKNKIKFGAFLDEYQVEEYIGSDFYHCDGIIIDNEIVVCEPGKYNTHADMEHIRKYGYWSTNMLDDSNPLRQKINQYVEKLLNIMPTPRNTIFHSELFIEQDGEIILCEIGSRMPGGAMAKAIESIYSIDLFKLSVEFNLGYSSLSKDVVLSPSNKRTGSVFIHPKSKVFKGAQDSCDLEGVLSYDLMAEKNKDYKGGEHSCDGAAMFVVKGITEKTREKNLSRAVNWFWGNSSWE
jgi:formate-dependent phosphoribosylglycinamide formyltransferase (GAR transformylase)